MYFVDIRNKRKRAAKIKLCHRSIEARSATRRSDDEKAVEISPMSPTSQVAQQIRKRQHAPQVTQSLMDTLLL